MATIRADTRQCDFCDNTYPADQVKFVGGGWIPGKGWGDYWRCADCRRPYVKRVK